VNLVDEQHVSGSKRGEETNQITRFLEDRSGGGAELHAHLARHQHGKSRFPQAGGAEEERMVQRVASLPSRVYGNLERHLDLTLTHEFVQPRRPERRVGADLFGQGLGGGDLESSHGWKVRGER
jgi:hypothetical protein